MNQYRDPEDDPSPVMRGLMWAAAIEAVAMLAIFAAYTMWWSS